MKETEYMGAYVVARWGPEFARVITLGMSRDSTFTRAPDGWAVLCHGATRAHAAERMREQARELVTAAELMEGQT
jgi:hypothetical protein